MFTIDFEQAGMWGAVLFLKHAATDFSSMISRANVLKQMQRVDGNEKRVPFIIGFVTANREQWQKKQRKLAELAKLDPNSKEYKLLEIKIKRLPVGGRYITHDNCVLSGHRGMHSGKAKDAAPRKISNSSHHRTRNIVFLPGNNIRTVHNNLIMMFNRDEVVY